MTRNVVYLIIIALVIGFLGLSYFGWSNRWGGQMENVILEIKPSVLTIGHSDKELALEPAALADSIWDELTPLTVPLIHQVTVVPWGRNLVPQLDVRAFHNGKDAYFLFEWKDKTASRRHDVGEFPDGVAISFSLSQEAPRTSIMMGFQAPINIWQWKADLDAQIWAVELPERDSPNKYYTYEAQANVPFAGEEVVSACQNLVSARPGTVTLKDTAGVSGRGRWHDGSWRVIIKRALTNSGDPEAQIQLTSGEKYIAFAVWDGSKGDRGSRKSISDWVILNISPAGTSQTSTASALGTGFYKADRSAVASNGFNGG